MTLFDVLHTNIYQDLDKKVFYKLSFNDKIDVANYTEYMNVKVVNVTHDNTAVYIELEQYAASKIRQSFYNNGRY